MREATERKVTHLRGRGLAREVGVASALLESSVHIVCLSSAVFKSKVIQTLQKLRGYPEEEETGEEEEEEEKEEEEGEEEDTSAVTGTVEAPPTSILQQHEAFMKRQREMAATYMERKRRLPHVSSRQAVQEGAESGGQGKRARVGGARTVSSAEKNRRRKVKKRRRAEQERACADSAHQDEEGPAATQDQ